MASGTISGSTSNKYIDSKIEWSSTTDIANNSSSVTAMLYYKRNNTGYTTSGIGSFSITINGTTRTSTDVSLDIGSSWVLAMTATVTVAHTDDGSKSITISAAGSLPPSSLTSTSCSGTATLDTIARASVPTVSASSVVMLGSVTITTNRKSSSFTHDLTYSFGGSTGTIATGVGASCAWTVPDLVSKISGKSSGTCTITCKTKSGSTVIGTKTVTLTLTIPAKSAPTAANTQMGKSVTIYTNRKSSGYTHTLSYTIGSKSDTIGTSVTGSKSWTPPKSLVAYTGNKTSATCTITCKTYNGSLLVGEATTTITLSVPDATVPAPSSYTIELGQKITIRLPRAVDVYVHDLTYTLKAAGSSDVAVSGTIVTGQAANYEWTVPLSLAAKIPSATKGTVTITCKTRFANSTTEVGSKLASFTVTVPNNSTTQPNMTMSLSAVSNLPDAFDGLYIAGKSKVKVSYDYNSAYSTFSNNPCYTYLLGYGGITNPYTSEVLANPGKVAISGTVKDKRGYPATKTTSIEVIDYSRPRITPGENQSKIVCSRCNSDGTLDPGGTYLRIQCGRKYWKVISHGEQYNYCRLSLQWKKDSDSTYSDPVTILEETVTSTDYVDVILPNIVSSNTTAYTIKLIANDFVGERDEVTITVPTAFVTWHSPPGGHGFTLGGYHSGGQDVFGCYFKADFKQGVNVAGAVNAANINGIYLAQLYMNSGETGGTDPKHFEIDIKLPEDDTGFTRRTIFVLGSNGWSGPVMGALWFRTDGTGKFTGTGVSEESQIPIITHLAHNVFKVKFGSRAIWDHFMFISPNDFSVKVKSDASTLSEEE